MTVRLKFGDMFTSDAKAYGHGVNVKGVMGAGVARLFATRHPAMLEAYEERCANGELQPGELFPWVEKDGSFVLNLATQYDPGPDARLEWLQSSLRASGRYCVANKVPSLAIPMIGCGIGGLSKSDVLTLITDVWKDFPGVVLEVWTLDESDKTEYGHLFDKVD